MGCHRIRVTLDELRWTTPISALSSRITYGNDKSLTSTHNKEDTQNIKTNLVYVNLIYINMLYCITTEISARISMTINMCLLGGRSTFMFDRMENESLFIHISCLLSVFIYIFACSVAFYLCEIKFPAWIYKILRLFTGHFYPVCAVYGYVCVVIFYITLDFDGSLLRSESLSSILHLSEDLCEGIFGLRFCR